MISVLNHVRFFINSSKTTVVQ